MWLESLVEVIRNVPVIPRLSRAFTFLAIERLADELLPAFFRQHPGPADHRRLVPHMLAVPALEIGDPIAVLVQVKADDKAGHKALEFVDLMS